jgi:hypothetical protein
VAGNRQRELAGPAAKVDDEVVAGQAEGTDERVDHGGRVAAAVAVIEASDFAAKTKVLAHSFSVHHGDSLRWRFSAPRNGRAPEHGDTPVPALRRGLTGDWLDPPAPLGLGYVAGRLPQCLPQFVTLKHHRVKARGAEGPESRCARVEQCLGDATTPHGRMDRQPVQVRAPAVPARYERADDAVALLRDEACSGVALKQGAYRLGRIAWPAVVFGRDGPQRKQFGNVVGCRDTKGDVFRQ